VGFRIATRFPFGLFEKSREVPAEGELIIYPRSTLYAAHATGGRFSGATPRSAVVMRRLLGFKLLREGEDPRDVHWRKSAAVVSS